MSACMFGSSTCCGVSSVLAPTAHPRRRAAQPQGGGRRARADASTLPACLPARRYLALPAGGASLSLPVRMLKHITKSAIRLKNGYLRGRRRGVGCVGGWALRRAGRELGTAQPEQARRQPHPHPLEGGGPVVLHKEVPDPGQTVRRDDACQPVWVWGSGGVRLRASTGTRQQRPAGGRAHTPDNSSGGRRSRAALTACSTNRLVPVTCRPRVRGLQCSPAAVRSHGAGFVDEDWIDADSPVPRLSTPPRCSPW